jgi:hypothetical protein
MPKEISVQDLLSKLSANSFLVDTTTQRFQVTPGIFLGMPSKFFKYSDVVDIALKIMCVNKEGKTVIELDQFIQQLAPKALDLNIYFVELEKTIKNPNIFDIKVEQTNTPQTDTKAPETKQTEKNQTQLVPQQTEAKQPSTKSYSKKYSANSKTYGNGKYSAGGKKSYTYTKKSYKQYSKKSGSK